MGLDFKYGTLIIKCNKCGNEQICEDLVTDGRAIYLFNKEDSLLKLNCPTCDISIEMRIRPSINIPVEDEELPQEITAEETI